MKLITSPRGFGKSTNLNMIMRFASIDSDRNTRVRDLFKSLKIYKNEREFFQTHFAKYPVLFVNLKVEQVVRNYDDVLDILRFCIHNNYLDHWYLRYSNVFDERERNFYRRWCGVKSYKEMAKHEIVDGLAELLRLLRTHFNTKVFVLIDEYDSVINKALLEVKQKHILRAIISLISDILGSLFKNNDNVFRGIATGVSYMSTAGLSDINNLASYRFLGSHDFVRFYGFQKDEVDRLFKNTTFRLSPAEIEKAHHLYNGYRCKRGSTIYNTYSVLNFLEFRKAKPYWSKIDYAANLLNLFRFSQLELDFNSLLGGRSINITFYDRINIKDVFVLKDVYTQNNKTVQVNSNLIFSHLLELGFLSYDKGSDGETVVVKIPNEEVYKIVFNEFKRHYIIKYRLSSDLQSASYSTFENVLRSINKN